MTTAELDNLPSFQDDIAIDLGEEFACEGTVVEAVKTAGELSLLAAEASLVLADSELRRTQDAVMSAGQDIVRRAFWPVEAVMQQIATAQVVAVHQRALGVL